MRVTASPNADDEPAGLEQGLLRRRAGIEESRRCERSLSNVLIVNNYFERSTILAFMRLP